MSISKILGFLVLSGLLISSAVAQSPAPAPFSGGGRRIISPAISPSPSKTPAISPSPLKTPAPKSSVASPPSPTQADSPSIASSPISDSPADAPGPVQSNAVSNRYAAFGGSVAVMLCAAVLAL